MPAATGDSCPALANARNIHRAMTRAHGQPRSHRSDHPPARPGPCLQAASRAAMPTRMTEKQTATSDVRQPSRRPSKTRGHPNPTSGATLRALVQPRAACPRHRIPYVCHLGLRWCAHPNPTWHTWMPPVAVAPQRACDPRRTPVEAPASPATCACQRVLDTQRRQ